MKCPFCQHDDTRVCDSRPQEADNTVRRRRLCNGCGKRFGTVETVELKMPAVISSDGQRRPFDAQRLHADLASAFPSDTSADTVRTLTEQIKHTLRTDGRREIRTADITETALAALTASDPLAAVRFAVQHRRFDNLADFAAWFAPLKPRSGKK